MKNAIAPVFKNGATNSTVYGAFEEIEEQWREFALEFVSVHAAVENNQKTNGQLDDSGFDAPYLEARRSLFSYAVPDSVRGVLTFLMNRVELDNNIETVPKANYQTLSNATPPRLLSFWD